MIYLQHVTKKYKKYTAPYSSLKSFLIHFRQYKREMSRIKELCVVKDLNMTIGEGEILCIVGRNGAGKSTLAKLIAGTISPTKGKVIIEGTIVPFLELGVAFQAELDGYDNTIMNGVLLGMKKKDIKRQMKDIFSFAEVSDFINTPLKFYSSGMLMRLAYSIGMHANGDIYIFDEILSVGDANFQKKCFNSFEQLIKKGKTIILITHGLDLVSKYATRVLLLNNGEYKDIKDKNYIASLEKKTINEIYEDNF